MVYRRLNVNQMHRASEPTRAHLQPMEHFWKTSFQSSSRSIEFSANNKSGPCLRQSGSFPDTFLFY